MISAPGGPFHDAAADTALHSSLKAVLRPQIPVMEINCAINDARFAAACAQALIYYLPVSK